MSYLSPDTTPEAHRMQLEALRKMTDEQRVAISFELSENVRKNMLEGIKEQHPDFTPAQLKKEMLRRTLSKELFDEIVASGRLE